MKDIPAMPAPFVRADDGTVNIPPVTDPGYMQALIFWSRHFGCSTAQLTEAHARLGRGPGIKLFGSVLKRLAAEEASSETRQQSTRQLVEQPTTVIMPLSQPGRTGRIAAWFRRRSAK